MQHKKITAIAHPNIAFIKYWGNQDDALRLPANGSISMNLAALYTKTSVRFSSDLSDDMLFINGEAMHGTGLERVTRFMDQIRKLAGKSLFAQIESETNFPIGAGIASSASAFAALALAGSAAAGLNLSENELSRLARMGSGSASRSIPDGYVEWLAGESDEASIAFSIATSDHWHLTDVIAVVSKSHKKTGSSAGHPGAQTSPYQEIRVANAPERLLDCRNAILQRDFQRLAEVSELDSTMMHAVMMTQNPPLFYWSPDSLAIIKAVKDWRMDGLPCFATLDAGPNVHVICPADNAPEVASRLRQMHGVDSILSSGVGGKATLLNPEMERK